MTNEERMITWCRMWSEDPALAHELMTEDCVQWSGQTAGLDAVVGPKQQEEFVTAYRSEHVNVFTPRVLADAGDSFAYLWDVRVPDGGVRTGLDVNLLAGDRIRENWTFVAQRRCDLPDPAATTPDPAATGDLCDRWLRIGNGHSESVTDLVTDDFQIFLGTTADAVDELRGPAALTTLIERREPGSRRLHRRPVLDPAHGRVVFLSTVLANGTESSAVDLLDLRGGRVWRAWSLSGGRAFTY
jgi:hypothetical protein